MKRLAPIAAALAALTVPLAACQTTTYATMAPSGGVAAGYVDGYYDDYYGPIYDGYWGQDAAFYYRANAEDAFQRDNDGHFRQAASSGYHPFHGRAAPMVAANAPTVAEPAAARVPAH